MQHCNPVAEQRPQTAAAARIDSCEELELQHSSRRDSSRSSSRHPAAAAGIQQHQCNAPCRGWCAPCATLADVRRHGRIGTRNGRAACLEHAKPRRSAQRAAQVASESEEGERHCAPIRRKGFARMFVRPSGKTHGETRERGRARAAQPEGVFVLISACASGPTTCTPCAGLSRSVGRWSWS